MKKILLLLLLIFIVGYVRAQPARKGWMGAYGNFTANGLAVDSVADNSTMAVTGIRKGDTITKLNKKPITSAAVYNEIALPIRTGDKVLVQYKRGKKTSDKEVRAIMRPYEKHDDMEVLYGWTKMDNCSLRTIVRRPVNVTNTSPAILLIPGYNCGSVENYYQGSYGKLIKTWISAGFIVVTIEKSGLGDSYGCVPCADADLATDTKVFEAGYNFMESLPYADKRNLFIWGHSMGGVIAPLVAQNHKPKGVIAFATVYRPWSEFLLEMHRVQWPLDGKTFAETEDRLRLIQKIYYEFFRLKKSPAELYHNEEYRDLVASELEYKDGKDDMWGRHWRFWQQLDSIDLARSWEAVDAPVLSIFGGADFIACSEIEHELIVRTVNSKHPGNARHINIPDVDHLIIKNADWVSAHKNFSDIAYRNAHFHQGFADTTVNWIKQQIAH